MKPIGSRSFLPVVSFALALLCAGCGMNKGDAKSEVMVPWDTVPAAVQKTISDNAAGQNVDKVEKETKGGAVVYEAKVTKKDHSRLVIKVAEDGKLVGVKKKSAEVEVAWKKVPKAVRNTITQQAGGGKVDKVEKETDDGIPIYEASVTNADGSRLIIKVGKDGTLLASKIKKD